MQRLLIRLIHVYRRFLSPLIGQQCRFTPSCSRYTEQAIELYGAGRGSWMGVKRILRCQPFCDGGWDPVPGSDADAALNELRDDPGSDADAALNEPRDDSGSDADAALNEPRDDPGSDADAALNEPRDDSGSDADAALNDPTGEQDGEPRAAKRSERGGSEADSDESARPATHRRRGP